MTLHLDGLPFGISHELHLLPSQFAAPLYRCCNVREWLASPAPSLYWQRAMTSQALTGQITDSAVRTYRRCRNVSRSELIAMAAELGIPEEDVAFDRNGLVSLGDILLERAGILVSGAVTALSAAAAMPLDMQTRAAVGRNAHRA